MHSSSRAARTAAAFLLALLFLLTTAGGAFAQASTYLSGIVTADGAPVVGAAITAVGSNLNLHTKTDARGAFTFTAIPIGTYEVDASAPAGTASVRVDLTGSGTTVTLALGHLQEIGRTAVTARPPVHGSGTDLTLSAENLTRSPAGGSLPELLLQLPGAARGANGVVHINGDHGDINYIVDGVPIPQELNRNIGTEFDPNDIAFVEALQGAYPAQYGERFASVLNINTRTGNGPPGFTGDMLAGSFAHADSTLGYHTTLGPGSLVLAARNERGDRGLDPPNLDSPHNGFSNANQFLRYTMPAGANFLNVTLSHAYRTYQIPNDVAGGQPASTDDNETQDDLFAAAQFRHPIGDRGSLSFGPSYKRSRIRDLGDPNNDFIYGMASNPGAPTDCANALTDPTVSYVNGTCGYSLNADRTAIDVGGNLDYVNRSAKHEVAFGGLYDATHVSKYYAVTLQPGNFLAPIFSPGTPDAAYTVVDTAPNVGHLAAVYLQDTWHMGDWQLDYGARADTFKISSTEFASGFGQVSPRVKLSKNFGGRNSVYAYYGRFFTPFSLENVSPTAAYTLNLPNQPTPAQFDLKPQRDSVYEVGGHFAVGRGDLGVRVMQKNATDLIDDTQVGVTNLHQDINYQLGRIATQTAYYQRGLPNAGRFYVALTHTYSVNKGCETQLLAPCFGASDDWTPADHDQRVDVTSGLLVNDRHNGWFAIDGEYGSGLSSSQNPNGGITCGGPEGNTGGPCKRTPHLTFDVEKGFGIAHNVALTLRVRNIFNDQYLVTYLNAQGNHWAAPRTIDVGLRFGR
ncbi:MAG TPA: carboxypeptidase regulatory-like domain-containing protein [Candidatus Elarobacter sp.]